MTASTDRNSVFVDTGVLVYAFEDPSEPKHAVAVRLLRPLLGQCRMVLSAEVLNEFYWVITRPSRVARLTHDRAAELVADLTTLCTVVPITSGVTTRAIAAMEPNGLSFWDALIWASAKESGAKTIYSEGFQHGLTLEGVHFVNPFIR